jgi:hypothetical protein
VTISETGLTKKPQPHTSDSCAKDVSPKKVRGCHPATNIAAHRLSFESDENGMRVRPVRTKSPFAKFKGIGNPGIGSGRERIIRWVRELRGR